MAAGGCAVCWQLMCASAGAACRLQESCIPDSTAGQNRCLVLIEVLTPLHDAWCHLSLSPTRPPLSHVTLARPLPSWTGDVYGHNIMLEGEAHAVLCDFGAAFCYDRSAAGAFWEAMEVRAFGLFMQGLLQGTRSSSSPEGAGALQQLQALVRQCTADSPADRPSFADIQRQLEGLGAAC